VLHGRFDFVMVEDAEGVLWRRVSRHVASIRQSADCTQSSPRELCWDLAYSGTRIKHMAS
jgi:hypothetical protein